MTEKVTPEIIIGWLKEQIEERNPIAPERFMDAAQKLIVFWGDLADEASGLETVLAQHKVEFLNEGKSVAEAKARVEAMPEMGEYKRIKARMNQITEFVRIAKQRARMKWEEEQSFS